MFFSYVLTLQYMCQFGMSLKNLNLNANHKIEKKLHDYFLAHLPFYFPTYLPT